MASKKNVVWDKPFSIAKNMRVLEVFQWGADPPAVWAHARVVYNGVRMEFTLFAPRTNQPWFGRFPGELKKNKDGSGFTYWHTNPFENPMSGKISSGFTKEVEDIFAKHIGAIFEEDEDDGETGIEAAIRTQKEATEESAVEIPEEKTKKSTKEKVKE